MKFVSPRFWIFQRQKPKKMSSYYNPIRDSMMVMTVNMNMEGDSGNLQTLQVVRNAHSQPTISTSEAAAVSHVTSVTQSTNNKKLLSTSSPEGIQVASKITAARLANLLIRKGPLPIRHITSQLAIEVPSFELLSLSKQRRLIMAAMEQTDNSNNVVFEKIGWGQWAVRKVDSDFIVTEGTESTLDIETAVVDSKLPLINVHELRNQANLKLGWSKKTKRRESITNNKTNLHNLKLPNEKLEMDVAIASDSEDESDDIIEDDKEEEEDDDEDEDDDELFAFDDESINKFKKSSPPIKFAKRVPLKVSPPPGEYPRNRRRSSNSSINKPGFRNLVFNRSRLNSMENLDNYIKSSAQNSNISINSPQPPSSMPNPPSQFYHSSGSTSALSVSPPLNSWNGNNYIHSGDATSPESIAATLNGGNRRKSSFNESHLRSTLSSSLPKTPQMSSPHAASQLLNIVNLLNKPYDNAQHANSTPSITEQLSKGYSDTDEEDWATIGAESLRLHQKKQLQQQQQHIQNQQHQNQQMFQQQSQNTNMQHVQHRHSPQQLNQLHQQLQHSLQLQQQLNGHALHHQLQKSTTPRSPILKLRRSSNSHTRSRSIAKTVNSFDLNEEEKSAAFALVDLRSV